MDAHALGQATTTPPMDVMANRRETLEVLLKILPQRQPQFDEEG